MKGVLPPLPTADAASTSTIVAPNEPLPVVKVPTNQQVEDNAKTKRPRRRRKKTTTTPSPNPGSSTREVAKT